MIVLDTNIVSALMRASSEPSVVQWLDGYASDSIWTTAVTVYELRSGIERLSQSRKRRDLEDQFERVIFDDLQEQVLSFDGAAAYEAAVLDARRRMGGQPVEIRDSMIAGIVLSRRAEFATRNVRHFGDLGVPVINPWTA